MMPETKWGKFLVVDDDPRNIDIIVHLLEDLAEKIVTASDAKEAIEKLEHFDADIALFDIMMPGMNGYDLCRLTKEKYPHLKVVLVSAKASLDERMAGYDVGADDYIPKPFDHDEFLAKMRVLSKLQQVESELRQVNQTLETRVMERTQEVKNMYQQLLLSSKLASLGEMSASIAHEINNPLTILRGNVDYLREVLAKSGNKEFVSILDQQDKAISRVVNIIQGLRKHARQDDAQISNFNAHKTIEESLALLRPLMGSQQIQFETDLSADSPFIRGVPGRFQQIVVNLVNNARDALKGVADAKMVLRSRSVKDRWELSFSDNGCGMSDSVKSRIFDPFFTTKNVDEGTGLGLSIVGAIVAEMNGTIEVKSEAGKGTTFLLSFPGLRADEVLFNAKTPDRPAAVESPLKGNVLVIDDEAPIAHLVERYLKDFGCDVTVALNGEEGLRSLQEKQFDLVLTDLQMPNMKGDEFVSVAKKMGKLNDVPVVVVTGIAADSEKERKLKDRQSGFDRVLAKPFSKGDVYEVVRDLL